MSKQPESFTWTEVDFVNFAKFVADKKNTQFTLEEEEEMERLKYNEGMFLGIRFSRSMLDSIMKHHQHAVEDIFANNGILACSPKPASGFCPVAIRAKLLPFIRKPKFSFKHEERELFIPDEVVDAVKLHIGTTDGGVTIMMHNSMDNSTKRAHIEYKIELDATTTKEEIDEQIIDGFTVFIKNVILFVDQSRLARYT